MRSDTINYSQCWEDPKILIEALQIQTADKILSITSGGDNTLALLCSSAKEIVSIDLNQSQNHLLELKRSAARNLEYEEYLEFIGVNESRHRMVLFQKIRKGLSVETDMWWASHSSLISKGVLHSGRFERFTAFFARHVLPRIYSKKTIQRLMSFNDITEQQEFYRTYWDTARWRFFFGLASSRLLLGRARQRAMFAHAQVHNIAEVYRQRLEHHLMSRPVQGNFFLQYSLTGNYSGALPPYLERTGYDRIKDTNAARLEIVTADLLSFLRSVPEDTFSKYNLSDIFEALSIEEHEVLWDEIVRTAKSGARIAYWTNLVPRSFPPKLAAWVRDERETARVLQSKDRVFFYDTFQVHTILK